MPDPSPAPPAAHPLPRWILPTHAAAVVFLQATQMAAVFLLPVLVRKQFNANEWQTLLITATPTIFFTLSIFWNDYFNRRSFTRYLLIYWSVACLPLALFAFATNYWLILIPHLITCIGGAGYHPAAGDLLKSLYPDRLRGRIYSVLWGTSMTLSAVIGYGIGEWMTHNENAFRILFPAAAFLQLLGVLLFIFLAHATGHNSRRNILTGDIRGRLQRLTEPVRHMGDILKADPVFARYEASYMTYGVGWMIAFALLPILVTDKLHLNYDSIAKSTHVSYLLALVAMLYPAGLLMDKLGAIKSTGLSFLLLTLYPVGLILARDSHELMIASIAYGIAHAGASVGWMLGPVALAPSPDKVPQYVAIHATLVGIRGKIFQGLGVLLYYIFHRFDIPLAIAALAYLWSAVQMFQLAAMVRATKAKKLAETLKSTPEPAAAVAGADPELER